MCPVYLGNFWTKRKIELHKYGCFWTRSMSLKTPHWPRVLPCPRGWSCTPWAPPPTRPPLFVWLSRTKLQIATNGYFWEKGWTFYQICPKTAYLYKFAYVSYTFYPNLPLFYTNIYSIYMWHFLDPCLAVMVLIYGKLLALLSPHFIINIIIAITHFAFPPNPLNWRKSQKWPIGGNLSIWRLDRVGIF